jgi:hypothetical protein
MNIHDISSSDSSISQAGIPHEMIEQPGSDRMERLFGWWYKVTMPPRVPTNASLVKREAERRARLISTIGLVAVITDIANLPVLFVGPLFTRYLNLSAYVLIFCMLLANKFGRPVLAGTIMVVGVELLVVADIYFTSQPLDLIGLQTYGMFIIGELIAVSLLPIYSVFVVALFNIAFMVVYFFYAGLEQHLAGAVTNPVMALVYPASAQIVVAGIASLWVYTASRASERANRAEVIARVEFAISEQHAAAEKEKQELEASIQHLVQTHIAVNDGQIAERIPYPSAQVLWPLVGVLNSLWARLRHAQQTELELQRLKQAIASYDQAAQDVAAMPRKSLPLLRTGTDLDPLILSLKRAQEAWSRSSQSKWGNR